MASWTSCATSVGSGCSWILPDVIRDTSSRSSIRRTIWVTWRSIIGADARHGPGGVVRQAQHVEAGPQRRQRIAQLVREDGDELVLAAIDVAQLFFLDAQPLLRLAQLVDVGRGADPADPIVGAAGSAAMGSARLRCQR